ncbi:MAG: endonuclease NucS domain-containing protein [Elusimicrobiota bacterium]
MLEKDIENLIARYPKEFFPKEEFLLLGQQHAIEGRRIDILFQDKFGRKIIVEVKRGIITREASGQVMDYGLMKSKSQDICELILCANVIPSERKCFLENAGIECKEVSVGFITDLAKRVGYMFIDSEKEASGNSGITSSSVLPVALRDSNTSVWMFQANPDKYDILNALSDEKIGNSIHWLVNQHKGEIRQGHIGLLWMSGKDSGIYAVAQITSAPQLMEEYPEEKKYWLGDEKGVGQRLRVSMSVAKRLTNAPLFRKAIKDIKGLEGLSILKNPQGTNFPVSNAEWEIILEQIK